MEALNHKIVPPKPKDLTGKLVLITGAGKGIGRALALQFAQHGVRLALWDIDEVRTCGSYLFTTACVIVPRSYYDIHVM